MESFSCLSTTFPWRNRAQYAILIGLLLFFGQVHAEEMPEEDQELTPRQVTYFEKKIRPLLAKHCYECHSEKSDPVFGGLKLDTRHGFQKGGDSGPLVTADVPDESFLLAVVEYDSIDDIQMPPSGRLPKRDIAELRNWIRQGAFYPADHSSAKAEEETIDLQAARDFWSFRPVSKHDLPAVSQTDWPRRRMDYFLLARMEDEDLHPSRPAERAAQLRRLSFDLTGLPPTPEELDEFLRDQSPDAYRKQVERLLENPHFGERWARMWLDLARYTDRTASWLDAKGEAYLYRDWVIEAMNDDLPYDQFVQRQLATDLMSETGPADSPALGFLGLSPSYWKELKLPSEIIKVIVADEWEERVDAVSRTFLGLTVACARCHDHKFDPITMEDYYGLAGVFASCHVGGRPIVSEEEFAPVLAAREKVKQLQEKIAALKKQKPRPDEEIAELQADVTEAKKTRGFDMPMAPGVIEESLHVERRGKTPQDGTKLVYRDQPRDLPLFIRGNPNRPGETVSRRFPKVLAKEDAKPFERGSGRLELAQSITNDAAPLAARVIVNRIWTQYFGRGLVATPSNFGYSGERPTHAKLLDDLAARLIENGWSLKWLHREIVLSAAYRQTSRVSASQKKRDPENRWYSRMSRRRLPIEAWRDSMLMVSGQLDGKIGGPSLDLESTTNCRRTIYGTIHRREMSTMLLTHDFPDPTSHSPQRKETITPVQGLYALNSPLVIHHANKLADRLNTEVPEDRTKRITLAYQRLFSRKPTSREIELAVEFLNSGDEQAWRHYTHTLLISNEFQFLE